MRIIVDSANILALVGGLTSVLGDRTSASAVLHVPPGLYLDLLASCQETETFSLPRAEGDELRYQLSLRIEPDPELSGAGGILTVT